MPALPHPTRTAAAILAVVIAATATVLPATVRAADSIDEARREDARVIIATQVMEELRAQRDQYIPDRLLERAFGIAIVPEVKKGAIGIGGRWGKGVMLVRDKQGRFTGPVFLTLGGGSFGWQIGVTSTDLVLVFTTRSGVEGIAGGKLTIGADASAAAGPVGRSASAATDATFSGAEIYSYSRSSGLFAGVALDGTVLSIDRKANASFYGLRRVDTSDILNGTVTKNSEGVRRLVKAISVVPSGAAPVTTSPATTTPEAAAVSAPATPAPAAGAETKTFPMEDAKPGQEPPR
jgi:lipid-binding SYLF domain-containing protein